VSTELSSGVDRTPGRWGGRAGHALVLLLALLLASFAFLFRFNALGGSLGGFDNDEFQMLTRVDLLFAGEQPLRDFADGDLRGVWPALSYEVPALAQRIWGRNLLVHAFLTLTALALCAGIVFVFARHLSSSWVCAFLAAGVVMASGAKAYNYTKVLALTVAAVAVYASISAPTVARLGALAAWTVIAALFRHDYGVYVAVAVIAGLVASEPRAWNVLLRRVATYVGWCLVFSAPSLLWLAFHGGISRYLAIVLASIRDEGRRLERWPVVDFAAPFSPDSLVAFNYYAFWVLPLAGAGVLIWRVWRGRPDSAAARARDVAFGVVLVAMTLVVNLFFLRANLQARFGDAVVPVALVGAWLAGGAASLASPIRRGLARAGPLVLLALMLGAFFRINSLAREFETGGLTVSREQTVLRFQEVVRTLRALPSTNAHNADGPMGVSRYLAECTAPDDRVLMGLYADEIPYFARRLFAAGQSYFAFGFLRTDADQRLALERLNRQSVPVVITALDYDGEIAADYPLVSRYISTRYREAGILRAGGQPYLRVFVDIMRTPRGTDSVSGLPCFR
jgi:hypothetical protein